MHACLMSIALLLGTGGPSLLTATAYAAEDAAWYVGEWKTEPENGMSIAIRFGANGKGVFGIYENGNPVQSVNIVYTRAGDQLVVTRNGVEMKFPLDDTTQTVKTGGGVPMARLSVTPPANGECEEACWAAGDSENDRKKKYGSGGVPSRFQYAVPLAEGPGYAAYQSCAKPHGMKAITDPVIAARCEEAAQKGCVAACNEAR